MATVRHYHHHYHFSYLTTAKRHFSIFVLVSVVIVILVSFIFHLVYPSKPLTNFHQLSVFDLIWASISTLFRLGIAYLISLIIAIPLTLIITATPRIEKFMLPLVDIVQSIPILAFFPILVLLFIKYSLFNFAAIFVLFMAMLWNIVFSMIGGLKTIPRDINDAAVVFKARGLKKLIYVTLPAITPSIITGSLLAWGQGWNITIVAEALHNYIPGGNSSQDLYGLGSLLVNSVYNGQNLIFVSALILMIVIIGLMNFFVWQKLLHLAERFKFDG